MSRRPLIAFALAETLSISGTRLSSIAIPWLVLVTTGSPVLTGLVALAEMLPYVVAKALGGPLIDRLGARRVAIVADLASTAIVAIIPLLHLMGQLHFEVLLPVVVLMGVLRGPSDAAKSAMVPDVAALVEVPLERVTGVAGVIERLGSTVGAAAAGGLIALIGPAEALAVNAATFALAALVVWIGIPLARGAAAAAEPYVKALAAGWSFVRRDQVLIGIALMIASTNFLDAAYASVLLPVWTEAGGRDASILGLLFAVFSASSMLGAAIATMIGERLPRLPVYVVAYLLTGLPRFAVFALDSPIVVAFVVLAIGGFASGFLNPIINAVIFERIPRPLLGRVSALTGALAWSLIPFGGIVGGVLIAAIGLAPTFWSMGLAYSAATLLLLALPGFRSFGERRPPAD